MARIKYYDSTTQTWKYADMAIQAPFPDGTAVGDTFVWDGTDWVLKAEVPNLYKEVDYIQSTGTQYIQLNFPLSSEHTSVVTCDGVAQDNAFIFGCGTTYSSEAFMLGSISATTTGTTDGGLVAYFDNNSYIALAPSGTKDAKTVYTLDKGNFYVNGELITTLTTTGTPVSDYNACLFTSNVGGTISGKCSTKLYGAKFYENGAVVSILVPCVRLSDDVAGLYDVVQQQFFTNAGTGSFATPFPIKEDTANKVTSLSSSSTDTQYPSAKCVYDELQNIPSIPSGTNNGDMLVWDGDEWVSKPKWQMIYQPCEWIQSNGNQRINTELVPNGTTEFEFKASDILETSSGAFIGSDESNSKKYSCLIYQNNWYANMGSTGTTAIPFTTEDYYICSLKSGIFKVNESQMPLTGTTTTSYRIYLFSQPTGYVTQKAKLHYCKLWHEGSLVRDFIPVYNVFTGEAGLFDKVNSKFYGNAGSGSFTHGADVN